jgi:hypothetical protein
MNVFYRQEENYARLEGGPELDRGSGQVLRKHAQAWSEAEAGAAESGDLANRLCHGWSRGKKS